ncbi:MULTISPECIES: hypothetical protein [Bacillus]|uniref:Uncharacterized protein n=1 Tax=Bacillus cereus TaxID=1396 RepID=A0A150AXP2_BACCE|nr:MULTISPECIES: hypothetical protein [Bacillus]KXX88345.1 hypothetical protein AT274_09680 [Bacillus cereus]MCG3790961.1 hypothetical protein [Bacillus sp. UTDS19-33BHI26]RSC62960.1 hypothetical protein EGS86_13805 [Bacillus sp. (in: firmicutes)]HDX9541498.1 hypothetical protein [Bacillus thuringiensis]
MDQLVTINEKPNLADLTPKKNSLEFKDVSYEESNLKNFTSELDGELGSLGVSVATLTDVEVLLAQLVEDMDTAVYKGEEIYCFRGFHRKLRVYWRLLNHTMNELNKEYERVDEIKDGLFTKVVKASKENQ